MRGGGIPVPSLKHLTFISDKISKGCFNFEAISGYDEAVRARVALEGYSEFSKIETDEVFGHFSVENTTSRDVTASGGAQDVASRQAGQADCDHEKVGKSRYLHHSNLNYMSEDVNEACGVMATRTEHFSKGYFDGNDDVKVSVVYPVYSFTTREGVMVKVYDDCKNGICSCNYKLHGGKSSVEAM